MQVFFFSLFAFFKFWYLLLFHDTDITYSSNSVPKRSMQFEINNRFLKPFGIFQEW